MRYGEITILLDSRGSDARLTVEDRGGDARSPDLFFQHDFEPASPASDETATRLGLWNVKRSIEALGGRISARRNQHGGATVDIVLPSERH